MEKAKEADDAAEEPTKTTAEKERNEEGQVSSNPDTKRSERNEEEQGGSHSHDSSKRSDQNEEEQGGSSNQGNNKSSGETDAMDVDDSLKEYDDNDKDVIQDHPFLGRVALVEVGKHKGVQAPIKLVKARGWWFLDDERMCNSPIAQRFCHLIEKIDEDEMWKYWNERGITPTDATLSVVRNSGKKAKRKAPEPKEDETSSTSKKHKATRMVVEEDEWEEEEDGDPHTHSGLRLSDVVADATSHASTDVLNNIQCTQPDMLNHKSGHRPLYRKTPRPLPPILLQAKNPHQMPVSLQHLDPEMKLDIFNRKTGRIMRDSVRIRDLPEALLMHAEYEPIIPPQTPDGASVMREGRSAANVRVSRTVAPQRRKPNDSSFKGRSVAVAEGPYRGSVGKVEDCLPGGWFLLKNVKGTNECGLPLVIGPRQVEVLPESYDGKFTTNKTRHPSRNSMIASYQSFVAKHFEETIHELRVRVSDLNKDADFLEMQLRKERDDAVGNGLRARLRVLNDSKIKATKELEEELSVAESARLRVVEAFKDSESTIKATPAQDTLVEDSGADRKKSPKGTMPEASTAKPSPVVKTDSTSGSKSSEVLPENSGAADKTQSEAKGADKQNPGVGETSAATSEKKPSVSNTQSAGDVRETSPAVPTAAQAGKAVPPASDVNMQDAESAVTKGESAITRGESPVRREASLGRKSNAELEASPLRMDASGATDKTAVRETVNDALQVSQPASESADADKQAQRT